MQIKLLANSQPKNLGYDSSSFCIDQRFLINSGGASSQLSRQEQLNVTHIFLNSWEWSAIQEIPGLAELRFSTPSKALQLVSSNHILEQVSQHLFNDKIWPNYAKMVSDGSSGEASLKFIPIAQETEIEAYQIFRVSGSTETERLSFIIDDGIKRALFLSEAKDNDPIWETLKNEKIDAIFAEVHYPSDLNPIAEATGRSSLKSLIESYESTGLKTPVYIKPFAPSYFSELVEEFHETAPDPFHLLSLNHEVEL